MPLSRSFGSTDPEVKYLFIDGGSLDFLLETLSTNLFGGEKVEIDYSRLANGYQKVFYYDCVPAQKDGESEEDHQNRIDKNIQFLNRLRAIDRFHVYEGTARFRDKKRKQEQKQVDIMIAVDMLMHSFRRNMHKATLLTGDLDFKPLIDALVQDGMYVSLWYPKGRTNYELIDAADSRQSLTVQFMWEQRWVTDSFLNKVKLPSHTNQERSDIPINWTEVETIQIGNHKASLCKAGDFAAVITNPTWGEDRSIEHRHDNLDQLRFYVQHLYGPDVKR